MWKVVLGLQELILSLCACYWIAMLASGYDVQLVSDGRDFRPVTASATCPHIYIFY